MGQQLCIFLLHGASYNNSQMIDKISTYNRILEKKRKFKRNENMK